MNKYRLIVVAAFVALLTPSWLRAGATASSVSSQNAVTSITGTAGQITASASTGAVTLSLPTALTGINSITAASATDLVLSGGSFGASLTLGQGASGLASIMGGGSGIPKLGIGTSSPIRPLQVEGVTGVPGAGQGAILGSSGGTGKSAIEIGMVANTRGWIQGWTNGTYGLITINEGGGNVLIGTTTDISGSGGLSVAGAGFFGGNLTVSGAGPSDFDASSAGTGAAEILSLKSNVASNSARKSLTWRDGSNIIGQIDVSYNGTTTSLALGHLYNAGYQTSDVLVLNGNGNATLAGNLTVSGATGISVGTTGATLSVKSGANAASGTVTLVAGTATITSTTIDVNTVIIFSEKTAGGTPGVYQPLAAVSAGSATVTSAATDTSTYNWIALKVAP